MNLDEFLVSNIKNLYVDHPDFKTLYMRFSKYVWCIDGFMYRTKTIQIANIESKKPGKGAFTNLILDLLTEYPEYPIIIECVHNERFDNYLYRVGFQRIANISWSINYKHLKPYRSHDESRRIYS